MLQIIEKQGEGKFVLAGRNIREGELVHASRSLCCILDISKIIPPASCLSSYCLGCLVKLPATGCCSCCCASAPTESSAADTVTCEGCSSVYCSSACHALNVDAHRRSGECAVIRTMRACGHPISSSRRLFRMSCLIARAQAEGFQLPSGGTKQDEEEEEEGDPKAAPESMEAEIDFVKSAPRESIEHAFPDMMQQQRDAAAAAQTSLVSPPPPVPSTTVPLPSPQEIDAAERRAALQKADAPSMADFFKNVSNASLMQEKDVETLKELYDEYRSLASASSSSPVWCKDVSWKFFLHLFSTLVFNCFCCSDTTGKCQAIGIGVFPDASYWNHSCDPSLTWRNDEKCLAFYARRDIAAGEPLTIDYTYMSVEDDLETRRKVMLEEYRFWCGCSRCVAQEKNMGDGEEEVVRPNRYGARRCVSCPTGSVMRKVFVSEGEERVCAGQECKFCLTFEAAGQMREGEKVFCCC